MKPRTRMASIRWSWVVRVKEEEDADAQTGKNSLDSKSMYTSGMEPRPRAATVDGWVMRCADVDGVRRGEVMLGR
jgi:hypothetical protein